PPRPPPNDHDRRPAASLSSTAAADRVRSRHHAATTTTAADRMPQHVLDVIDAAAANYRRLQQRVWNKQRAVERLLQRAPKSLASKSDVHVSKALAAARPAEVEEIRRAFGQARDGGVEAMHRIIGQVASAEATHAQAELGSVRSTTVAAIEDFFRRASLAATSDTAPSGVDPSTTTINRGEAPAGDAGGLHPLFFTMMSASISLLDSKIQDAELSFAMSLATKAIKAEAAAAKKAAAAAMEVDTPNDVMVADLVKREITKSTAALRKEVNQLRAALNVKAGRPGQTTQAKTKPKAKAPSGGARAVDPPRARSNKPPRNATAKQAAKPRDAKNSKSKREDTKKRTMKQ
ncbi:hypothetical protein DYB32_007958, partial [Aphanomyces invadans]